MADPLVVFEGVCLRAPGGRLVFEDLDWALPLGARVRVVSGRGAGATAVLRLCAGLAHPQGGRVLLDGVPHHPRQFAHPYLRRGGVAWIPQDGALISNLTLVQNVALPLRFIRGMRWKEAEEKAMAMLEILEMGDQAHVRPDNLLSPERQMGALARSVVMRPELWLLDRPLDDRDGRTLGRIVSVLEEILQSAAVTLLVVGNDPRYESLAPTAVRLEGGRLVNEDET